MSVNINSMDLAVLIVFKRELQSIETLNRNVSPDVIEYLTQRISEIEEGGAPRRAGRAPWRARSSDDRSRSGSRWPPRPWMRAGQIGAQRPDIPTANDGAADLRGEWGWEHGWALVGGNSRRHWILEE